MALFQAQQATDYVGGAASAGKNLASMGSPTMTWAMAKRARDEKRSDIKLQRESEDRKFIMDSMQSAVGAMGRKRERSEDRAERDKKFEFTQSKWKEGEAGRISDLKNSLNEDYDDEMRQKFKSLALHNKNQRSEYERANEFTLGATGQTSFRGTSMTEFLEMEGNQMRNKKTSWEMAKNKYLGLDNALADPNANKDTPTGVSTVDDPPDSDAEIAEALMSDEERAERDRIVKKENEFKGLLREREVMSPSADEAGPTASPESVKGEEAVRFAEQKPKAGSESALREDLQTALDTQLRAKRNQKRSLDQFDAETKKNAPTPDSQGGRMGGEAAYREERNAARKKLVKQNKEIYGESLSNDKIVKLKKAISTKIADKKKAVTHGGRTGQQRAEGERAEWARARQEEADVLPQDAADEAAVAEQAQAEAEAQFTEEATRPGPSESVARTSDTAREQQISKESLAVGQARGGDEAEEVEQRRAASRTGPAEEGITARAEGNLTEQGVYGGETLGTATGAEADVLAAPSKKAPPPPRRSPVQVATEKVDTLKEQLQDLAKSQLSTAALSQTASQRAAAKSKNKELKAKLSTARKSLRKKEYEEGVLSGGTEGREQGVMETMGGTGDEGYTPPTLAAGRMGAERQASPGKGRTGADASGLPQAPPQPDEQTPFANTIRDIRAGQFVTPQNERDADMLRSAARARLTDVKRQSGEDIPAGFGGLPGTKVVRAREEAKQAYSSLEKELQSKGGVSSETEDRLFGNIKKLTDKETARKIEKDRNLAEANAVASDNIVSDRKDIVDKYFTEGEDGNLTINPTIDEDSWLDTTDQEPLSEWMNVEKELNAEMVEDRKKIVDKMKAMEKSGGKQGAAWSELNSQVEALDTKGNQWAGVKSNPTQFFLNNPDKLKHLDSDDRKEILLKMKPLLKKAAKRAETARKRGRSKETFRGEGQSPDGQELSRNYQGGMGQQSMVA